MADTFEAFAQLTERLVKGQARGGRYYRRTPTGNPKSPWRYFYTKQAYEKVHGDQAHLHGGDAGAGGSTFPRYNAGPNDPVHGGSGRNAPPSSFLDRIVSENQKGPTGDGVVTALDAKGRYEIGHKDAAERVVVAPGRKFHSETTHHADGSRTERVRGRDGYETETTYKKKAIMTPRSAQLNKSLHAFTDAGYGSNVPRDAYVPEYVDSFINEVVLHERSERAGRDPHLEPAQTKPGASEVHAALAEFKQYVPISKSLSRAAELLPITFAYVAERMIALGLLQVEPVYKGVQSSAFDLFTKAEEDRAAMKRDMGARTVNPGDAPVQLRDDGVSPYELRNQVAMAKSARLGAMYGSTGVPGQYDASCLFHRDRFSAGIPASCVGAVCTCPSGV